jgi:hypothetical protein
MANTHELFRQAEIANDPQMIRRKERLAERWNKDFYRFGRENNGSSDQAGLERVAFLGYN